MSDTKFVVLVESEEARSSVAGNPVLTKDGDRFWVTTDREGWVEANSVKMEGLSSIPVDAKPFKTREDAEEFALRWNGHPWWCKPKHGKHEVIEVRETYRPVHSGYERVM